jgi:octaprenyl-diphosphate synthase
MNLEQIQQPITQALAHTEAKIAKAMRSDVALICQINDHIIQGGKRARPITSLLIAGLFGEITEQHVTIAAIIEFVHTATLLHDDVVDQSTMRRGLKTANEIWGNEASVLVGDFLYSRAFQLMTQIHRKELMEILADASNIMAEGEVLQLMNKHNVDMDKSIYDQIIHAKTAALFQAACAMSATASSATPAEIQRAADFGRHLGMTFQLIDDALDYTGDSETLGKNVGDDIAEGKFTLPLIYALSVATEQEKHGLIAASYELNIVKSLIQRSGAIEYTLKIAQDHGQQALQAIEPMQDSLYKKSLQQLIEFVLTRQY